MLTHGSLAASTAFVLMPWATGAGIAAHYPILAAVLRVVRAVVGAVAGANGVGPRKSRFGSGWRERGILPRKRTGGGRRVAEDRRSGRPESRSGGGCSRRGGGCGCAFPSVVVVVGIVLALFGANVGIGLSARVPFTESNLTVAGSVGGKQMAMETLPEYARPKVADNENFINQSITLTIWPAEGVSVVVLGKQEGAPVVDLHLDAKSR